MLSGISTTLKDETLLPQIVDCVNIANTTSKNWHCDISPESLLQKLRIGLNTAHDTLKVTTQQGIRQAVHPITRRYHTDTKSLKGCRLKANVYTDTSLINRRSLSGNVCYQSYFAEYFIKIIPMKDRKNAADSLMTFAHDVGALVEIVLDHVAKLIGPESKFAEKTRFLSVK